MSERIKRLSRFLDPIFRKLPVLRQVMKALALPLEEGFRILATADKMYDQKKVRFTYSGDPSVARADIGRAWITAQAKEINRLIEKVYCTGEARPSEIVSNYSAILVLRRDFIITAVSLMIIAVCITLIICYKIGLPGG